MEKLQAALARAREKRDGSEGGRPVRSDVLSRQRARRSSQAEAVDAAWAAIAQFDPSPEVMAKSRIFASKASSDGQYFDILRTKLLLEMRRNNWTRVAITSATPSCGKTTISCNLIAGIGRQPEIRGILLDMDFRRPSVGKAFGLKPSASLEDVLTEAVAFEEQAVRPHVNTIISVTTSPVPDPAQLMNRSRTAELLDDVQQIYRPDVMLFDLPPVLISEETRAFLKLVDAAVIIAAAESTTISQVDETEREVAQYTNVAGVVLNKCRHMGEGYGYGY